MAVAVGVLFIINAVLLWYILQTTRRFLDTQHSAVRPAGASLFYMAYISLRLSDG